MGRYNSNNKLDWKSKFIDLFIVIIGITIAFKLNTWNESLKQDAEANDYFQSFYDENLANQESLLSSIAFSTSNSNNIDTLKAILTAKNYEDQRIKSLVANMMSVANFNPSTTTMQNIIASGEFELIKDAELRKQLINTYDAYKTTDKLQTLLRDYINNYVSPYIFEHVRFSDFSSIQKENFSKDPLFENIVFGYDVLLNQLINGYEQNAEILKLLNEKLKLVNRDSTNNQ